MSISEQDFQHARTHFPSLVAIYAPSGQIDRVTAAFRGIVGGRSRTPTVYQTVITFDDYPQSPPTAWITSPLDGQIRHMNIFHPGGSLNLPRVCMGNYPSIWSKLPTTKRDLHHFMLAVHHVLMNENPNSPARR